MSEKGSESRKSRRSTTSKIASRHSTAGLAFIEAATRKAELKCRVDAWEKKIALEQQELDLKRQKELLNLETEMKIEEAKIATLEKYSENSLYAGSSIHDIPVPHTDKNTLVGNWLSDLDDNEIVDDHEGENTLENDEIRQGINPWSSDIGNKSVIMEAQLNSLPLPPTKLETELSSVQPALHSNTVRTNEAAAILLNLRQGMPVKTAVDTVSTNVPTAISVDNSEQIQTDTKTPSNNTTAMGMINMQSISDLTTMILEQQRRASLPQRHIKPYSGEPLEYCSFIQAFKFCVEDKTSNDIDKLYFLEQLTVGEPNRLVKGFLNRSSGKGYEEAKALLAKKFGNRFVIADSFKKKAEQWHEIKNDDEKAWTGFSIFLIEYMNTMMDLNCISEVDHSGAIRMLLNKIPYRSRNQWRVNVDNIETRENRIAGFKDFVDFIEKQTRIICNPLYGKIGHVDKLAVSSSNRQRKTIFSTDVTEEIRCLSCGANSHKLETCKTVQQKSYSERIELLKRIGLCFACLKKGSHLAKDCRNKLKCDICKGQHPTILHREKVQPKQSVDASLSCSLTGAGSKTSVMSVVPVTVLLTFALLDNKSTAVFCTENLRSKLEAKGIKTKLSIQTINGTNNVNTVKLRGLEVTDAEQRHRIELPDVYVQKSIPVIKDDIMTNADLRPWPYLHEINFPDIRDGQEIGLLIGNNVPKALEPLKVIQSHGDGPYASKSVLGWEVGLHGLTRTSKSKHRESVHRIIAQDDSLNQLKTMYNTDFTERKIEDIPQKSREDRKFLEMVGASINLVEGHYEIDLPLRDRDGVFPDNRVMAENRIAHLKRKFHRNPEFKKDYVQSMNETLLKGYAEKVPEREVQKDNNRWYIPHHGVRHPRKQKLRVVFDCAATYHGTSLNKKLLQGPDLTNTLVGVILRFRQQPVAILGDIEGMFNQVKVPRYDREFLRFLWWPDGDVSKGLSEYRMTTHLFGATSSPSCANFALLQTAIDNKKDCSKLVVDTIQNNFYVDDCVRSVPTEDDAILLINNLCSTLQKGGFRLTKWSSNSKRVLQSVPKEERAKSVRAIDLKDELPNERALGVLWMAEKDTFGFKIELQNKPITRRGVLSIVSSIYDPLGFAGPAILPAKRILQDLCNLKLGWDDEIPENHKKLWINWTSEVKKLEKFTINRCLKPPGFNDIVESQYHHFADASELGYGTVSYIRLVNSDGKIHCNLVLSKSRVAPLKKVTIPRMELTAATVAVRVDAMLRRELQIPEVHSIFWTDSTTVLRYISNESARFHTFVANRVDLIREASSPAQWRYVESAQNPADECSRGLTIDKFLNNIRWSRGPEFLWHEESKWPKHLNSDTDLKEGDPEIKVKVCATQLVEVDDPLRKLFNHFSKWYDLKRAVAYILMLKSKLLEKVRNKESTDVKDKGSRPKRTKSKVEQCALTVQNLKDAEIAIIRYVQHCAFATEIEALHNNQNVKSKKTVVKSSQIYRLDPILRDELLRVGGRLGLAEISDDARYPIILPKNSVVSDLLIREIHEHSGHAGRNQILSTLQQKYWIIQANSAVRKLVNRCVTCRRQRAKLLQQKMSNLPVDRINPCEPPFSRVGMDYFGPLQVKQGRSLVKRYGVVFVCLASKAIHIEKAESLDTDACINVVRRFTARRGAVKTIRSDNGTNLVGAAAEMKREIAAWNSSRIHDHFLQKGIDWTFNPPAGSHHGGIWERQIRTIRKHMYSITREQTLTDDSLLTLLCEIEMIVNCRPITRVSGDSNDLEPLTPNHLLHLRCNTNLPPVSIDDSCNYPRRRWKQVQYLADIFWRRWTKEYLPQLQERQKWVCPKRSVRIGDIVLVTNEATPRNVWPIGRVTEVLPGRDGLVRQVRVKTKTSLLTRPITKLCMLLEAEMPE